MYQDLWWGNDVTDEGGQKKGVYTDAFWLAPPYGRPRDIDYERLEPLEKSIWVRMVNQHIVDSVSGAAWNIVPRKKGKDVPDATIDEVTEFFEAVKWSDSWNQVLRQCLPEMVNYDSGVVTKVFPVKAYDGEGDLKKDAVPIELMSIDGRSVLKDVGLFKNLRGYWQYSWINPQGQPIFFSKDELMYMQQYPSTRGPYGMSTLEVVESVIEYMVDSTMAQSKYWKNGLFIGGQIDLPEVTDITELKRAQAYYEAKLRGPKKYNKWIVTGGGAKVQSIPFTSQQMQWLDSQKWFAKMVFGVFKVTPSELGFTEDLNRATGIQQMQIQKSKAIRPILTLLEEYINRQIIWKHFSEDVVFEFKAELDLEEAAKQADIDTKRLTSGLDSVNELRDRDGKDKWDDEKWDLPMANEQMPEEGEEGDVGNGDDDAFDWGNFMGKMTTVTIGEDAEIPAEVMKAAMVSAMSGEPGYVPMPEAYDGMGKPVKTKKNEKKILDLTSRVWDRLKKDYDRELDGVFEDEK
jgi:hypothetical protein